MTREHLENQDLMEDAVYLDSLENQEKKACLDDLEDRDFEENRESLAKKETPDRLVYQEWKDVLVRKVCRENKESLLKVPLADLV